MAQTREEKALPTILEHQRLGYPHGVREGSPGARIGWMGFLAGSGGSTQPPAHNWAEEVKAAMSECLNAASLGAIYHLQKFQEFGDRGAEVRGHKRREIEGRAALSFSKKQKTQFFGIWEGVNLS